MSREIDARVAREVMGFDGPEHYWTSPMWKTTDGATVVLPAHSTDMNAAMGVVAHLFASGWLMELFHHRNGFWFAWFKRLENEYEFVAKQADTPALAICLAALEAVKSTG